MVVSLFLPDGSGNSNLKLARIDRCRAIRSNTGVCGAFSLEIDGFGELPECRVLALKKGGFFAAGEWHLRSSENSYVQFIKFERPFSTWLARAARIEIIEKLVEDFGDLPYDFERLRLEGDEMVDRAEPRRLMDNELVTIIPIQSSRKLINRKVIFDAVLGQSIRICGCQIVSQGKTARLVLPTSEGLKLRPVRLERAIAQAIIERDTRQGISPEPIAV